MTKKNILFVVDEKKMGGVSVLLEDILNTINIKSYNIDVLVLHNNGDMLNNLPKKVNIIYGTKYFSGIDYTLKEALSSLNPKIIYHKLSVVFDMKTGLIRKKILRERKKILNKKYDIEIAFKDGFTALFTAFGDSYQKIHWLHYEYKITNPNGKYDKIFRKALPMFDKIIAVSEGVETAFNNIYHLKNKTEVIYNLVNTDKIIKKSKEIPEEQNNKENLNITSLGRLSPEKGYSRLIKVINKLNEENLIPDNFQLKIYGSGNELTTLQKQIEDYHLENKIFLKGRNDNPYKYIKNSDLFILPSYYEAFGLVIIEAMTLKVPVLATKCNATEKLINHNENGYIAENSEDGLYQGIKYLLENQKEIKKYQVNLKEYNYDNTKIIKQLEGVLKNEKQNNNNH